MTTQLEAMKMMVEALEYYSGLHRPETDNALAAGRAAIEAAEKDAQICEELRVHYGNGDPDGDECAAAIRGQE